MPCPQREAELAEYMETGSALAELTDHLAHCADCRATMAMWQRLDRWPDEAPDPALAFRFRQRLAAETRSSQPAWGKWAAVAAAVVVAFLAGRTSTEVGTLRQEVRGLREVVALSLLEQQSASERLRGIRYTAALEQPDEDVIAALTRTLRSDGSVDVRLAAADALRRYARLEPVKRAARELLMNDDSPLVQVAGIDLLVAAQERGSMEKLRTDPKLDPAVRQYLESVLQKEKWQ